MAERTGVRSSAKVPDQSKMRLRIMRCRQLGYSLLGIEKKDSSGQGEVGVSERAGCLKVLGIRGLPREGCFDMLLGYSFYESSSFNQT